MEGTVGQTRNIFQSAVTLFSGLFDKLETNFKTIASNYSGTSFPTSPSPETGQHCFRTDRGDDGLEYIYTNNPAVGESGWVEVGTLASIGVEVLAARGSKSTLAQFLAVAFNLDGTLKAATTLNPSQWYTPPLTSTYVDADEFTVPGDQTDIFTADRRLKINLTASTVYSSVTTATFNAGPNNTTVQIANSVLDATLASVDYALFTPLADADSAISLAMLGLDAPPGGKYTMTGNQTFADHGTGLLAVYLLDPNGADRNFTPTGTWRACVPVRVKNISSEEFNIYAGALNNIVLAAGEWADIYYDGALWNRF
jgi:hypothetical protein